MAELYVNDEIRTIETNEEASQAFQDIFLKADELAYSPMNFLPETELSRNLVLDAAEEARLEGVELTPLLEIAEIVGSFPDVDYSA